MRSDTPDVWSLPNPTAPALDQDLITDVVVIGAGITGVSIAHELARRGRSAVVIDRAPAAISAAGETGRSTAHLTSAIDDRYMELERELGFARARLVGQSQLAAIRRIESIATDEAIDCDFSRLEGFLTVPHTHAPHPAHATRLLGHEQLASSRAGVHSSFLSIAPGMSADTGPCLRYPNQAQLHPLRYLLGLRDRAAKLGVRFFASTHAAEVRGGDHPVVVTDRGHTIAAAAIIVATNAPIVSTLAIPLRQTAYRTYAIAIRTTPDFPQHLWWDGAWNGEAYHYVRVAHRTADAATIVIGGEDHVTGREPHTSTDAHAHRFERLERWARASFPLLADPNASPVTDRWSGQVFEPHDGLPLIGRAHHERHIFLATGDSGQGFTSAAIAAMLLPDLVDARKNPWETLYAPTRAPRNWKAAIAENLGAALSYGDWLTPKPQTPSDLRPGQGIIVRIRGGLRAISMAPDGVIHERSAVCPHLSGLVRWNSHEQSWDCPCHGSRFDDHGELLTGPANESLAR